ncbi:hypothetical protein ElyMa_006211300 [Elysia marginata]|uniref:Uncharacterized protein n=1 Tax=Elysia marginata TaxID=1093978 RepID=A0AAV4H533_9GAST|nr:hypothetical protein ElyMa_006211300 [Elysia marginata]
MLSGISDQISPSLGNTLYNKSPSLTNSLRSPCQQMYMPATATHTLNTTEMSPQRCGANKDLQVPSVC